LKTFSRSDVSSEGKALSMQNSKNKIQ